MTNRNAQKSIPAAIAILARCAATTAVKYAAATVRAETRKKGVKAIDQIFKSNRTGMKETIFIGI